MVQYNKNLINNKKKGLSNKLTGGNFLYHTKATTEIKENSTNYFINFCFGELLEAKEYKIIINNYENEISGFSKEYLAIKLKYINIPIYLIGESFKQA